VAINLVWRDHFCPHPFAHVLHDLEGVVRLWKTELAYSETKNTLSMISSTASMSLDHVPKGKLSKNFLLKDKLHSLFEGRSTFHRRAAASRAIQFVPLNKN